MTQPSTSSTPPATIPVTDNPDWTVFAAQIRDSLLSRAASWAVTAYTASAPSEEDGAEASVATATDAGHGDKATFDTGYPSDITQADTARSSVQSEGLDLDDLLDQIEAEADAAMTDFGPVLPPVPEYATAPRKLYRLRPEAALAVVRLARTFGSADTMVRALGARGAVTLITTADTALGPLEQLVDDLQAWKAGKIPWRDVSRGILLAGPPGTGKTETARQVAREAGIGMIAASLATWQARGERSSDLLRAMKADFAKAASEGPCIIFVDEIDVFGDRNRRDHNASWTEYVVGSLLECLDGFTAQEGVVAMAATNHVDRVDPALRRPGRFDRILRLGHPTAELMPQAIRWQVWPDLRDADLTAIAAQAAGMSGADVAGVVRTARAKARRARRPLSVEDLSAALSELRPPMGDALRWQVAVHEAGHALVGVATSIAKPRLLALQGDGGVTHADRRVIHQRRSELNAALALDMAGRAAERVVFGEASAGAGGAADSDLARATTMAIALEAAWGLGDRLTWRGDPETIATRLYLDPPLAARVEDHLRRAEDRALHILQAQRPLLEEIAAALCDRVMLQGAALEELMAEVRPEAAQPTRGVGSLEIPKAPASPGREGEPADNQEADWSASYRPLDRAA